ncbi:3-hydroxylacyl-ACP dehydratase [Undibacterium sp. Ren11W]|uniref:ApeP family dehydratase n=1 Tax=Undibacterium sp. Ren11W TaxID=3413045 RepID=UPI003BEFB849
MTYPDIRELVPHSGPMVLLDRVVAADEENLSAEVTIRASSMFCDGTGVAAWVGVEYMAQAIAAHAGYLALQRGDAVKVGFLLGARRYHASTALFALGSVLVVRITRVLQGENGLAAFECSIHDNSQNTGASLAHATITVFQPDNVAEFIQEM